MPALAVPYLLPFAEAAGIAIAGLGLMEISKQVQKFMDINPEETFKILTLLAPAQGIMALFNKEAGEEGEGEEVIEEGEEIIDLDEDKPKSKKSKKEIVLEEVRRARGPNPRGNWASKDATGPAVSGRGNVRRGLEEAGKIPKDIHKTYDPNKPKFNWRKFRKADGGRIGFEVGGSTFDPSTLDAQARSIYDAWISAGHPEADVLAYLKSRNMYNVEDLGITSIVNTAPVIGGDGGGGGAGIISTQPSYKYKSTFEPGSKEWLTDIGEGTIDEEDITWGTQWNELKHQYGRLPTPFNLVRMGITGAGNWWDEQQKKYADIREQKIQEEIEAANLQAAMDAQQARATSAADLANIQQIQQYTGQGLSDYRMDRPASERQYTGHGRSGMGRDPRDRMADGGLATMFKRKR